MADIKQANADSSAQAMHRPCTIRGNRKSMGTKEMGKKWVRCEMNQGRNEAVL